MSMYFINDIENEMQKGENNNQIVQTILWIHMIIHRVIRTIFI